MKLNRCRYCDRPVSARSITGRCRRCAQVGKRKSPRKPGASARKPVRKKTYRKVGRRTRRR